MQTRTDNNGNGAVLLGYWPELVALFTILLAMVVTAHVVTNKRDARAAAAWTGLVWLVPVVGALLYLMLGINRIQRRARQLAPESETPESLRPVVEPKVQPRPRAAHLRTLSELAYNLTELPLVGGNRITPMEAPEGWRAMVEAVEQAQSSIYLCTYIFGNDAAGRPMVDALGKAVRRGVEVRVLVDGMGALYSLPTVMTRLRRQGVPAQRFLYSLNPVRMPYMNLRNHRKVMVVDRSFGFTGGMNLRAKYITDPPQTRDTHVRVDGPVVEHLLQSFAADWYFTCGETIRVSYDGPARCGSVLARGINAGPDADFGKRWLMLLAVLGRAQEQVRIVTPYFVPEKTLMTALQLAALRGVRVELVLPEQNNLRFVHWASLHLLPWLVESGCEVWFSPAPFDHGKIMTVDHAWCMVGSGNWDARSLRLNFEFDLECYDPDLTGGLNAMIDARQRDARRVTLQDLRAQPRARRLRNALAHLLEPYL